MTTEFLHTTVLLNELVDSLNLKHGDCAIDCTAGGGGHTSIMLDKVSPSGLVFGIDRDAQAIRTLEDRFSENLSSGQLQLIHAPFSALIDSLEPKMLISGIGMDLGVSSPQIDLAERGFSFSHDGPLDMRMSPETQAVSAADVISDFDAEDLEKIFYEFGEEPKTRFIVKAIVAQRQKSKIETTFQLADLVKGAVHYKKNSRKHPATRVFQALRIFVNQELEEIKLGLSQAFSILRPGGRLAVISFHSLEDRIVKRFFNKKAGKGNLAHLPRDLPFTGEQLELMHGKEGVIIKPFPLLASDIELKENPRARSAKLRVIEKI